MAPAEPNALPFQTKGQEPHFPEELEGWKGYIEWEKYPEKKKEAEAILDKYDFPDVSRKLLANLTPPLENGETDGSNTSLIAPRIPTTIRAAQQPTPNRGKA